MRTVEVEENKRDKEEEQRVHTLTGRSKFRLSGPMRPLFRPIFAKALTSI